MYEPVWNWEAHYIGRVPVQHRIHLDTELYVMNPVFDVWKLYHNGAMLGAYGTLTGTMAKASHHYYVELGHFPAIKKVTHTWLPVSPISASMEVALG